MPPLAQVVANHFSPVRAAGLYLSWFVHGYAVPAVLRINNKAHQFAPSAPDALTARRCAGRYMAWSEIRASDAN